MRRSSDQEASSVRITALRLPIRTTSENNFGNSKLEVTIRVGALED
jgi:hypothetical protein